MKFVICDSQRLANCLNYIQGLPLDKKMVVEIKKGKRSLNQNDLWHKWVDLMSSEAGMSPEDMKIAVKRMILGLKEIIDPLTGEVIYTDYHTSELDKEAFSNLMIQTQVLAMQYYGLALQSTNEAPEDLWQR